MTEKIHWTRDPKFKEKLLSIRRASSKRLKLKNLAHQAMNDKRHMNHSSNGHSSAKQLVITIQGPDSRKALTELISNVQYEKMNVSIKIERH